jgi:hypothetical protein
MHAHMHLILQGVLGINTCRYKKLQYKKKGCILIQNVYPYTEYRGNEISVVRFLPSSRNRTGVHLN